MIKSDLTSEKAREIILKYIKDYGCIRKLSDLSIYRLNPNRVYAEYYKLQKDGIVVVVNGIGYLKS